MNTAPAPVPALPDTQVRACIEASDWVAAAALLDDHRRTLGEALGRTDFATTPREPWLVLLTAQRALMQELFTARNEAELALARLGQDRRGAHAWLRELA